MYDKKMRVVLLSCRPDGGATLPSVLDIFGSLTEFDLIDSLSESKGAQTLVAAIESWTKIDEHQRLPIPAEAILEEVR